MTKLLGKFVQFDACILIPTPINLSHLQQSLAKWERTFPPQSTAWHCPIGNESAPIQLAQCRFPGLAISSAKI